MDEENKQTIITEEVIEETETTSETINDKNETEKIKETSKTSKIYESIKDTKDKQLDRYKKYAETETEDFTPNTSRLSAMISWDIIKILIYVYIMSFIIYDIQNFLLSAIIALLLIKIDILEPILRYIRSFFKK